MTTNLMDDNPDDNQVDPNKNYLEELVGEGKKFRTNEDLAKAKAFSDTHIRTLEQRLDEMREDYLKAANENKTGQKLQELLDKLEQKQSLQVDNHTQTSNEDNKPGYTPDELESLVSSKILQSKQVDKEDENVRTVMGKLKERFGSNYKSVLKEQSDSLGLSDDDINLMARRNPNLFFKTFDLNETQSRETFQTPPRSELRSMSNTPNSGKRTLTYYQNLRKKDPKAYYDPKIAVQMDKDSQELGQAFFDA